jgi:hypothetical protein
MKLTKLTPQILVFKCKTKKELALTFFRVQEFYEAQNAKLRGQSFDTFKFLDVMMADNGKLTYFFPGWSGFNFPSDVFHEWRRLNPVATSYEAKLISQVEKALPKGKPFYVVAMLEGDKDTLDHEVAHAMFFLNKDYRECATALVRGLPTKLRSHMLLALKKLGYAKGVTVDEINAFLATSDNKYLWKRFKLRVADLAPIAVFQAAFLKYKQLL